MFRHALSLLLLASVVLAPTVVGGGQRVSIPVPREGSEASYVVTSPISGSSEFTLSWEGPVQDVRDGFDGVHRAYPVRKSPACAGWDCDRVLWFDVATRSVILYDEHSIFEDEETQTSAGPASIREFHHSIVEARNYIPSVDPSHALQGRSLSPGNVITILDTTFTAVGWETVEGERLFRVETDFSVLWFDGKAPVPARVASGFGGGTIQRLTEWSPGDGSRLREHSYVPPTLTERAHAVRATIGVNGPDEPMSPRAPLQEATAALHAHPQALAWFLTHPDAYLVTAAFEESLERNYVFWGLMYEGAAGQLEAELRAPLAPEGETFVVVTNLVERTSPAFYPPQEEIVGRSLACSEEAFRVIERAEPSEPEGGWAHLGSYKVNPAFAGPADITCVASLWPPEDGALLLGRFTPEPFDLQRYDSRLRGGSGEIVMTTHSRWAHGIEAGLP